MPPSQTTVRLGRVGQIAWLVLLIGLCVISLRLTTTINSEAIVLLRQAAPGATWIGYAAIPSCLAALLIYLAIRPQRPLAWAAAGTDWPSVIRLSLLWLTIWIGLSVGVPYALGRLTPYATAAVDVAAFIVFGALGEELLFRGAIFEVAQRALPTSPHAPLLISTLAFSLHHFELHADPLSAAALGQVAFTVPMGLVFARIRQQSQSLWPGFLVHVLTNLPGLLG